MMLEVRPLAPAEGCSGSEDTTMLAISAGSTLTGNGPPASLSAKRTRVSRRGSTVKARTWLNCGFSPNPPFEAPTDAANS